jgi:hypothetical protein
MAMKIINQAENEAASAGVYRAMASASMAASAAHQRIAGGENVAASIRRQNNVAAKVAAKS